MTGRPGEDLVVRPGLAIPVAELVERFSRSSGPGGQSVNTTDSRVELVWDVGGSVVLGETLQARVVARLGTTVSVVASDERSQHRNRVLARERLAARVRAALAPPPPVRRPTRPSRSAQRRRVEAKQRRGSTKRLRGRVRDE